MERGVSIKWWGSLDQGILQGGDPAVYFVTAWILIRTMDASDQWKFGGLIFPNKYQLVLEDSCLS